MDVLESLRALARHLGVHTHFVDGLHRPVEASADTLVRVCAALGAEVERPEDAEAALARLEAESGGDGSPSLPPVLVAWDGYLPTESLRGGGSGYVELEAGGRAELTPGPDGPRLTDPLPLGYHTLQLELPGGPRSAAVISAPVQSWRRPGTHRSWGVGTQLAALRSDRSRSLGDLRDLETVCRWVGNRGETWSPCSRSCPPSTPSPPSPAPTPR